MLEKLSKEQEELMYKHRRDFIDFIINNGKYQSKDLELTPQLRDDIDWVYKKANLKPPKFIFMAKSFWEEKLMINAVFHMFKELLQGGGRSQVGSQVWNQVRNQVGSQVRNQVGSQVWNQVWNQVGSQVRNQVWNQVGNQVSGQVWNQVSGQVRNQVGSQVRNQKLEWVEQSFGLPWNSYWFSFYTYFKLIDIVNSPDFDRYYGLVKNHGLWSIQFFENWCIVTQLPKVIRRDNENRLHSTDAPTIEWRNGQKDYYIHGVYFPSEFWEAVVSGNADPKTILKIQNQEQRQAALSIIPISVLLKNVGAVKISSFKNPRKLSDKYIHKDYHNKLEYGYQKDITLYQIQHPETLGLPTDEQVKILHYFCPSTGREYFDYTSPEINDAKTAISWKFGLSEKEYMEGMVVET